MILHQLLKTYDDLADRLDLAPAPKSWARKSKAFVEHRIAELQKQLTGETVADIAKRLGVNPKVARARLRRAVAAGALSVPAVKRRYVVAGDLIATVEDVIAD